MIMSNFEQSEMKKYIGQELTDYMNNEDYSDKTFFRMAVVFQLSRIAEALEYLPTISDRLEKITADDFLHIVGEIDSYEQNH